MFVQEKDPIEVTTSRHIGPRRHCRGNGSCNIVWGSAARPCYDMRVTDKTTRQNVAAEISGSSPRHPGDSGPEPGIPSTYPAPTDTVLCVDLDGTLVRTDLLWECIVALPKAQPLAFLLAPAWLLRGRARFKEELGRRAKLDVTTLPYRKDVLSFLQGQHEQGRPVALVTAAENSLAERVADHLGVFDRVYGSRDGRNLKGQEKAALLQREFGERGYEYVGDSRADLPAWKGSRTGYVVGNERLARRVRTVTPVERVFENGPASAGAWLRVMRAHHWTKNLLLFLPLLLAHHLGLRPLLATATGFLLFSLCASGVYIVNDLLDLHSDRAHPWKAKRPFASGETSIAAGLLISSLLTAGSIGLGFLLSPKFGAVLLLYIVMTFWYSLQLKRVLLVDVFVLSSFYSVRIWAGSLIAAVPLSDWFLVFSLFFFLSLAMAKRYSELVHAGELAESGNSGRSYIEGDRALLMHLGIGSSFAAVVILALYAHSQEFLLLYRRPEPLLLTCPVILYWLSRVWLKAHRGELYEDPLTLSIRDPVTYVVAAIVLTVLIFSSKAL
jgi:4-hydroxybenzoate polyprenyltransferase/phosphoserine phosphatase